MKKPTKKEYNKSKQELYGGDSQIFVDISAQNFKKLEKKYPSVNLKKIIEGKINYYRRFPFDTREKKIWIEQIKDFLVLVNQDYEEENEEQREEEEKIFGRRGQIESFWKKQPFFYDKSKIFWLWNNELRKWELSDEVDYLNSIQKKLGIETIDSKARNELVEGFKQIGRLHKPKDVEKTWVQFKDKIYDVKTGESFDATPEYFVTNPIPWNVGKSEVLLSGLEQNINKLFMNLLLIVFVLINLCKGFLLFVGGGVMEKELS